MSIITSKIVSVDVYQNIDLKAQYREITVLKDLCKKIHVIIKVNFLFPMGIYYYIVEILV